MLWELIFEGLCRSVRKAISLVMIFCILFISLGCQVHSKLKAEPVRIDLSAEEKNQLDDFFSAFSEAYLTDFSYEKFSNDQLIEFALRHFSNNKYSSKYYVDIPDNEVDKVTKKYFGQITKGEEGRKYRHDIWILENGVYQVLEKFNYIRCEMPPFSQVDELWDNGNGTFSAVISVYDQIDGWKGDPHGTMEDWKKGDPQFWPKFKAKYRALIRPVREGDEERYILLEYVSAQ